MNWRSLVLLLVVALMISTKAFAVEANMYIFAVSDNGEGIPAKLIVDVTPGSGKISLTLNAIVGEDTQKSIKNAIMAAVEEAGKDFYSYNYSITIQSGAKYVGGPSAGLPIALAVYAALEGKDVPDWISGTGTIDEEGDIGPVGGIFEKAKAAHEVGVKLFLIPQGERYVEVPSTEEIEPGVVVPSTKKIDIVKYAKEKWGMDIYEVSTFHQAVLIAFKGYRPEENTEGNVPLEEMPEINFVPPSVPTKYSEKFKIVVENLLKEFNKEFEENCLRGDQWKDVLVSAKSYYERARLALEKGYYYTAGNYAFLGATMLGAAELLCEHPSMRDPNSLAVQMYVTDLQGRLKDLTMRAEKYTLTTKNYEWVGGARERILRAESALNQSYSDPVSLLRALKSVEYWLDTAQWMLDIADEMNGGVEFNSLADFARNEIIFVEDLLYSSGSQNSGYVSQRIEIAKEAYDRGWYFAAYAEAALAKGILVSENVAEDELSSAVKKALKETENYHGMWAELYRNHGIYYREAAYAYKAHGMREKEHEMLRTSLEMLEAAKEFSYLASSIVIPRIKVVREGGSSVPYNYLGVLFVVLAAVLLVALLASIRSSPHHRHLYQLPKEKREEAKKLIRELETLKRARERLLPLLKHDTEGTIAAEIKRIDRKIEAIRKKLEKLAEPEPPRRSSRRGRGKRQ